MSDPIHTSIPVLSTHVESKEWISNSQLTLSSSLKNFCNDAFNGYFLAGMTFGRAGGILMKCESFSLFSKFFGNSYTSRFLAVGFGLGVEGALIHLTPQVLERGEFIREGAFLGSLNSSLTILACQIAMRGAPPNRVMREVTMNCSIMGMEALTQVIGISDQPIHHTSAFDWYLSTQLASIRIQVGSHCVAQGLPHLGKRESRQMLAHQIERTGEQENRGSGERGLGFVAKAKEFLRVPSSLLPGRLAPEGPEGKFNSAIGAKEEARGFQMTRSGEGGENKVSETLSEGENRGEKIEEGEKQKAPAHLKGLRHLDPRLYAGSLRGPGSRKGAHALLSTHGTTEATLAATDPELGPEHPLTLDYKASNDFRFTRWVDTDAEGRRVLLLTIPGHPLNGKRVFPEQFGEIKLPTGRSLRDELNYNTGIRDIPLEGRSIDLPTLSAGLVAAPFLGPKKALRWAGLDPDPALHTDATAEDKLLAVKNSPWADQNTLLSTLGASASYGLVASLLTLINFGIPLSLLHSSRFGIVEGSSFGPDDVRFENGLKAMRGECPTIDELASSLEGNDISNLMGHQFDNRKSKDPDFVLKQILTEAFFQGQPPKSGGPEFEVKGACIAAAKAIFVGNFLLLGAENVRAADIALIIARDALAPYYAPPHVAGFGHTAPRTLYKMLLIAHSKGLLSQKPLDVPNKIIGIKAHYQNLELWYSKLSERSRFELLNEMTPTYTDREGMTPGEGAMGTLYANWYFAIQHGLELDQLLRAIHITAGEAGKSNLGGTDSAGLRKAVQRVLQKAIEQGVSPEEIEEGTVHAHDTGTKLNAKTEEDSVTDAGKSAKVNLAKTRRKSSKMVTGHPTGVAFANEVVRASSNEGNTIVVGSAFRRGDAAAFYTSMPKDPDAQMDLLQDLVRGGQITAEERADWKVKNGELRQMREELNLAGKLARREILPRDAIRLGFDSSYDQFFEKGKRDWVTVPEKVELNPYFEPPRRKRVDPWLIEIGRDASHYILTIPDPSQVNLLFLADAAFEIVSRDAKEPNIPIPLRNRRFKIYLERDVPALTRPGSQLDVYFNNRSLSFKCRGSINYAVVSWGRSQTRIDSASGTFRELKEEGKENKYKELYGAAAWLKGIDFNSRGEGAFSTIQTRETIFWTTFTEWKSPVLHEQWIHLLTQMQAIGVQVAEAMFGKNIPEHLLVELARPRKEKENAVLVARKHDGANVIQVSMVTQNGDSLGEAQLLF